MKGIQRVDSGLLESANMVYLEDPDSEEEKFDN